MAKNWKLQDIKPPERKKRGGQQQTHSRDGSTRSHGSSKRTTEYKETPMTSARGSGGNRSNVKKMIVSVAVFVVVIMAAYAMTTLMRGADVTVYPKHKDVNIDARFTSSPSPENGQLGHELLTLEETGERTVTATGEEEVAERARGTITIYNEYSTSPQRLIKNTRFASPDGLIFRIPDSLEVPGYTENEEGAIVPGTITAEVFAEEAGESYNIDPARFTIPGLEGTDQYDEMYATSQEAFTGGFEGTRFVLDENEAATAKQELHEELRGRLLDRLQSERPAGFELFDDAVTFTYESLPSENAEGNTARIKERVRLVVPLFADAEFAAYIAANTIAGYEDRPVRIEDSSGITFSYPATTTEHISEDDSITFTLNGNARIVWTFDKEQLRKDLSGLEKTALPNVLSGYPAVTRAESTIRPFWKQSFPEDPDNIEIIEIIDE